MQFVFTATSYAANCLHPKDWEGSKCIYDYAIPCSPGFYNIMTLGGGYGLGDLTYDELVNFFCKPCEIGFFCPGDNHIYRCENANERVMDKCPEMNEGMKKAIDSLQAQRIF